MLKYRINPRKQLIMANWLQIYIPKGYETMGSVHTTAIAVDNCECFNG